MWEPDRFLTFIIFRSQKVLDIVCKYIFLTHKNILLLKKFQGFFFGVDDKVE